MKIRIPALAGVVLALTFTLAGCASAPPETPAATPAATAAKPATEEKIAGQHKAKWDVATEPEVAAALDKKFENAVKGWTKLTKDGVVMFCKRYKPMGSSISQIRCLTESEVRQQVESMDQYRKQMRSAGKCPHGPQGCRS
jgi:type IV pilus biogenesis protein CpaD/CtpE